MVDAPMHAEPEVAIVFTPEPWVGELHRFLTDHGGARVREIVMDQRLALEDAYEVLVLSHRWPALTRSFVKRLHDQGRVLLGVFDGDEPTSKVFLANLGADAVVSGSASMAEFLDAIQLVAPAHHVHRTHELDAFGELLHPASSSTPPKRGRIIAVGGPAGAGRTEVACALHDLANAAHPSVLVDADDVGPSVAQRLGLPIEPNLRTAIDATAFGLGNLDATIQRSTRGPVLSGLPNVAAWSQVRPTDVDDVLAELARVYATVIVDVGPSLEAIDCVPRDRNAITHHVLTTADCIVMVAAAQPLGVTRALTWAAELRVLAPETPIHGVLNRAPRDRFRRRECADELSGTIGFASLHTVPSDPRVERAHWEGRPVGRSPFRRAMQSVAATVLNAEPSSEPILDLIAEADRDSANTLEATA